MNSLPRFPVAGKDITNLILSSLADNILGEMAPFLEVTELRRNQVLCQPGNQLRRVHFIQSGLVIFAKMMQDGRSTMIGSAGFEGMTMPNVLSGMVRTDIECSVYIEGKSLSMSVDVLERLSTKHLALSAILKRYDLLMSEHIAQLSGCNRLHALEQRCARLLLTIHDNANAQPFPLTQEALAMMLGAQRPHVSAVAAHFQQENLIQYRHGQIRIVNPASLKNVSCECYGFIEEHIEAAFGASNGKG
jgi:CRP-like cAMP-binding protein